MISALERGLELARRFFPKKIKYGTPIVQSKYNTFILAYKITLPQSYIDYICNYGFFRLNEMMPTGIIDEDNLFETGLGWVLNQNKKIGIPKNIVLLDDRGDGSYYALDLSQMNKDQECPVVVWPVGGYDETPELEIVAPDFGTWFLQQVEEQIRNHAQDE